MDWKEQEDLQSHHGKAGGHSTAGCGGTGAACARGRKRQQHRDKKD
jgi:hypothetical protein